MKNQSKLTVERLGSFIGLTVAEIRGAYLELNPSQTRIQRGTSVRVWKHLTRSSHFKSCVPTIIKSRVSITIKSRVSSSLMLASPLDHLDKRVYESCVLSHIRSMSLLLQSVQ